MAKIKILGSAYQLVSNTTPEELETAVAYYKDAATLKNEEGEPVFKVSFGTQASMSEYGVTYSAITPDGKMYLMGALDRVPGEDVDVAEIKRDFAPILFNLRQVEKQLKEVLEKISELEGDIAEDIVVMDSTTEEEEF